MWAVLINHIVGFKNGPVCGYMLELNTFRTDSFKNLSFAAAVSKCCSYDFGILGLKASKRNRQIFTYKVITCSKIMIFLSAIQHY